MNHPRPSAVTADLSASDFAIFGLPQQFEIDTDALTQRWKEMLAQVHPDRFAAEGEAAQRLATQWSVRINEAYQRLINPVKRAALLCELANIPLDVETNTAMPVEFLMQQMQWREQLEDATTEQIVELLRQEVDTQRQLALTSLTTFIDEKKDYPRAAQQVRALMFMDRFLQDLDAKLDTLGI